MQSKPSNWVHQSLDTMRYAEGEGAPGIAGPTTKPEQTRSDWHRQAISPKCTYYINGTTIHDLHPQGFKTADDLREFFNQQFVVKAPFLQKATPAQKTQWIEFAMQHFDVVGLFSATDWSIRNTQHDSTKKILDPINRIDFEVQPTGLLIRESNTYTKWKEMHGGTTIDHICGKDNKPYYAQTKTEYLVRPSAAMSEAHDFPIEVVVKSLQIDCPSRNLAPFFDKRPPSMQMFRGPSLIRQTLANIIQRLMHRVPSPTPESSPRASSSSTADKLNEHKDTVSTVASDSSDESQEAQEKVIYRTPK